MGAAVVVPLAESSPVGWRLALGIWVGLALIAMAVLLPWLRRHSHGMSGPAKPDTAYRSPWGSALGWQVTIFMGLQSIAFYVLMAWLPSIEQSRGVPAATAGFHLSVFLLISVFASLAAGGILHRESPQAASLSGMAQSVGYVLAALGPVMFGGLRDVSGGWTLPLLVTAAIMAVLAVTGILAGRDRVIAAGYV